MSNDQAVVKIGTTCSEIDSSNRLFVVLRREETDLLMRKRWKILKFKGSREQN